MAVLDPISIPNLAKRSNGSETLELNEPIPGFDTLTPVKGTLTVTHSGNYLEVSASLETILTLACHRCLQQYNHKVAIQPNEYIWLRKDGEERAELLLDQDLDPDDLVESLPPNGSFDPGQWIYEQLCLEVPRRQLCDASCPGISVKTEATATDARWAKLASLQQHMPDP
jgi:uncharacterized protein